MFDTKVKVDLNVTSESGKTKTYTVNLERTNNETSINTFEQISIHSNAKANL